MNQDSFDDGRSCPSLLLECLDIDQDEFIVADQLLEAQERRRVDRERSVLSKSSRVPSSSDIESSLQSSSSMSDRVSSGANDIHFTSKRLQNDPHLFKTDLLIMQICPEIGLHAQAFTCVDCGKDIDLNSSRLCHYDGRYYCYRCHTGSELMPIPARVLRSWDFTPKPVSKTSLQKICLLRTKPVLFNLFQINSMLYGFIDKLVEIKKIRERIQSMLKYLEVCGQPNKPNLIQVPKHFLSGDLLNFFTLNDLYDIDQVHELLDQLQYNLESHIVKNCESCRGKGYYCELCKDPHDVLYPFSKNSTACSKCNTVYHKNCFHRKKRNCPRCIRLNSKRSSLTTIESNSELETQEPVAQTGTKET